MIKDLLQHVDQSSYRALILSDRHAKITVDIKHCYTDHKDKVIYSGSLRMFRFPSGAMIWVHPVPKNHDALMKYAGMTFHSIVIEGAMMSKDIDWLKTRLRKDTIDYIPLSMYEMDKKLV